MSERHIAILMPAHNEAAGIRHSLDSALAGVRDLDADHVSANIHVLANGCSDDTTEVASAWAAMSAHDMPGNLSVSITELADGHKIRALNHGIERAEGDITFVMDADVTVDRFGLAGLYDVLKSDRPRGASLYHAMDVRYVTNTELSQVVRMGDLRRQAIPRRAKLHGGFMGWNSQAVLDGREIVFPADKPISDDTWLSFALVDQYGLDGVHSVDSGIYSRYVPPRTEADFIEQHSRYEVADDLVLEYFPQFADAFESTRSLKPPKVEIESTWRRLCLEQGVNFQGHIAYYQALLRMIRARKESITADLVARDGQWSAVASARVTQ